MLWETALFTERFMLKLTEKREKEAAVVLRIYHYWGGMEISKSSFLLTKEIEKILQT